MPQVAALLVTLGNLLRKSYLENGIVSHHTICKVGFDFVFRLAEYAKNNPQYANAAEVEDAILADPETWTNKTSGLLPPPYKRLIIELALCIETIKCPFPLPWSDWRFAILLKINL